MKAVKTNWNIVGDNLELAQLIGRKFAKSLSASTDSCEDSAIDALLELCSKPNATIPGFALSKSLLKTAIHRRVIDTIRADASRCQGFALSQLGEFHAGQIRAKDISESSSTNPARIAEDRDWSEWLQSNWPQECKLVSSKVRDIASEYGCSVSTAHSMKRNAFAFLKTQCDAELSRVCVA